MSHCKCGSYAINHHLHGRDGSDSDLCDVCYWRKRAAQPGWREFIKNIATVGSEPLNSAVVYRDLASRRHFMAELRNKARALLAAAPKPEDVK